MSQPCFLPARILLPGPDTPTEQWACLACDQFTSQPEYWRQAERLAAGVPSALHLVLPEVYLEQPGVQGRIEAIHAAMRRYRAQVLTRAVEGFVYLERTTPGGAVRPGLLGKVDLEAYDYTPGSLPPVRPTEGTVVQRIPPRLAVRRGACLESPHVMMLADDAQNALLGPLAAAKEGLQPLYSGPLMLGGGWVRGWAVTEPALCRHVLAQLAALGSQAAFDAKYPQAAGRPPLTLAVGDGNHSLATAKAYWEELKPTLPPGQRAAHPARWCLAEVCSLHDPSISIEPIHRVVYGVEGPRLYGALCGFLRQRGALCEEGEPGAQRLRAVWGGQERQALAAAGAVHPLAVGTLEAFLEQFLPGEPGSSVDYVHGEDAVRQVCRRAGAVGLLLPPFAKEDIFKGVVLGGVLPRKSFSMGHATDKRYYLECRAIEP